MKKEVETMKNKILNYTCKKCDSTNYKYTHDFKPMENKSVVKFTCKDCGHVEYK